MYGIIFLNSVFIVLVLFFSWPFCRSFIYLQFHTSIQNYGILFIPISYSFFFFLLLKLFFFSISPFNKKVIFIFYVSFDPYSFDFF
jgi:hypothetical protein